MSDGTVLGTGIDLVENDRMQDMMQRWGAKFLDRVFLAAEQAYCNAKAFPCRHYAGRFAVKEAVSKAFGTGLGPSIGWLDIEVVRDETSGAPSVRLDDKGLRLADARGVKSVLVSLSHTKNYAVAQALLIGA
jgi:holo-[acyl-carrier protein] synthase